jgi:L-threonylcarbamoyladenylate synthase
LKGAQVLNAADGAKRIASGELLAFPTETVYGLGADASSDGAVAKIFVAKGRPADHPLIVHVADAAAAAHFAAHIPDFAQRLIDAFWPGPLTVIVPRKSGLATAAAGGQDSIGLRCPAHPVAQALLAECAKLGVQGIAAPSANKFGKVSPTTAAHVLAELGADIPVLDGGACAVGIESTIIDCTRGAPILLRPGVLTIAELEAAMARPLSSEALLNNERSAQVLRDRSGKNVLETPLRDEFGPTPRDIIGPAPRDIIGPAPRAIIGSAPRASGTLASHYAPEAIVRLMDAKPLQTALDLLGADAKNVAVYARSPLKTSSSHIIIRRMPQDALATAQQLFAVLRAFDAEHVKLIWVENVPLDAAWDGVRDRLQRASA